MRIETDGTMVTDTIDGALAARRLAWRGAALEDGSRSVAEELPLVLSFNRISHAVMLGSPIDLEDFAVGFSLADGVIERAEQILSFEAVRLGDPVRGIELRMTLSPDRLDALDGRRRFIAGPSGCGLCGLDSLEAALRPVRQVAPGPIHAASTIAAAVGSLREAQALNRQTRAVHAAGFWRDADGLVLLREDVGRHNALDKLHGGLARRGIAAASGIVVMTSRVSVELVQKAATMGAPVLAAISAPTSLAIATAQEAGITLVAIARDDGFEIFTHPDRIAA
ncbi:formate dehydrogenase accessory sulfurtransferase FdhD [Acetobacteraceae bacterium KSS8]|uniref:Sulfur carrier protein FdhD n=1 Tax=Endosaccharibacter trunci TaxID=2812733 RepID=A0ABT1WCU2_9PROT|nr:formate dehydrogenase accessory sulfurtransferase FdhD [Acetobacteraceae bacterium KSS8]